MISYSALLPNTDSHSRVKVKGIIRVPITNWRMVRPREMRAVNRPTNGDRATHHAQKKSVQLFIHSTGRSKAKLFSVMPIKRLT